MAQEAIVHLLQVSACNGFIVAKKDGYSKTFLNFLESIILSWVFQENVQRIATEDIGVRFTERHFFAMIPPNSKQTESHKKMHYML